MRNRPKTSAVSAFALALALCGPGCRERPREPAQPAVARADASTPQAEDGSAHAAAPQDRAEPVGLAVVSGGGCRVDGAAVRCFGTTGLGAGLVAERPIVAFDAASYGAAVSACALLDDGTARCWSKSAFGATATTVSGLPPAVRVSVRPPESSLSGGACAVTRDGEVWRWLDFSAPGGEVEAARVEGLSEITRVACGLDHSCAVRRDGRVLCWGAWHSDELGIEVPVAEGSGPPREVPSLGDAVEVAVAAGGSTCVVRRSGGVACLGGITRPAGTPLARPLEPVEIEGLSSARGLVLARRHGCAVDGAGQALCFGDNTFGQLGDGTTDRSSSRARPVVGLARVAAVAAGEGISCAISDGDRVSCWGRWIGPDASADRVVLEPRQVPGLVATRIFAFGETTCALVGAGELRCFGEQPDTPRGILGMATPRLSALPEPGRLRALRGEPPPGRTVCGLWEGGDGRCWHALPADRPAEPDVSHSGLEGLALGAAGLYELRTGGEVAVGALLPGHEPEMSEVPGLSDAAALAARQYGCAVRRTGRVACVDCSSDECGPGFPAEPDARARELGGVVDAAEVALGLGGGCVRTTEGRVSCWGYELGNPDNPNRRVDEGLSSIVDIDVGDGLACALSSSGELFCHGVLFEEPGGSTSFATPRRVLEGVAELALGASHACARTTDGRVLCLGENDFGEIGVPARVAAMRPVAMVVGDPRPQPGPAVAAPDASPDAPSSPE
jgi:hypothetical protein